jgi:CheY-like chemotaxis protein
VPQNPVPQGAPTQKIILLVEDDPDDQELLKEVFASIDESFTLVFVSTGRDVRSALEKLNNKQMPCLIILDYNMPGLNGPEILKEINQNPAFGNIPKIVWSTSEKYKSICMQLGAADYIIKPTNNRDLQRVAKYMLSLCAN